MEPKEVMLMKALTIYPAPCEDIYHELKTIEVRTWKTKYRGRLLICAAKRPTPGCVCGYAYFTVNLTDIEPLTEEHLKDACMSRMPHTPSYAWHFEDVEPVYPIPVSGKMGLFDVDDSLIKNVVTEEMEEWPDDDFKAFAYKYREEYIIPITYKPDLL